MIENNRKILEKVYQTTSKIVLIQILFTIILIVVAWFWAAGIDNSVAPQAITGLWFSIIFLVIASFFLRRVLFSWGRLKNAFEQFGVEGVLKNLQKNTVIICLLGQIVGIIGFLIATLSVNKFEMFRAGIVALVIFLFNFPRKGVWEKVVVNFENTK